MSKKLKKFRLLPVLVVLCMAVAIFAGTAAAVDEEEYEVQITRLEGETRYETAVAIAEYAYDEADTVVIARADELYDALSGSVLAAALEAPVLLTKTAELPKETASAIEAFGATEAIILGGPAAVSEAVEAKLEEMGLEVSRYHGDTRYETAADIAREAAALLGAEFPQEAFIVSGERAADALTIGPYAAKNGMPILLVQKNAVPEAITNVIEDLEINQLTVIGGTAVVSDNVKEELGAEKRIYGADRYETSANVASEYYSPDGKLLDPANVIFARGHDNHLVDAMAGGYFGAIKGAPILYTSSLDQSIEDYFLSINFEGLQAYILGGKNALSEDTEAIIENIMKDPLELEEDPLEPPDDPQEVVSVEDITDITDITVAYGTAFDDVELPEEVEVTFVGGSTDMLDVEWDEGDYDGDTVGTYNLEGELVLPDGVVNPDGIKANVGVIVQPLDNVHNETRNLWYDDISSAIGDAEEDNVIRVYPGTYAEQIVINKSLTLVGPNDEIAGYSDERGEEAVIQYPSGITEGFNVLVDIDSDDVTISGFTFNDNLTEDLTYAGAWPLPLSARGIRSWGSNTVVEYNKFSGFNNIAVHMTQDGAASQPDVPATTGNITRFNFLENGTVFNSIYYQAAGGLISDNQLFNVGSGIQVQPYRTDASGMVSDNEIVAYAVGLYYNYANGSDIGVSGWTFSTNTITAPATTPDWSKLVSDGLSRAFEGVRVETYIETAKNYEPTAHFESNIVDANGATTLDWWYVRGMFFRNVNGDASQNVKNITFANNDFSNVEVGVQFSETPPLEFDLAPLYENDNTYPEGMVVIEPYQIGYAPVKNITQKLGYHAIQDAIDDADTGDTIEVSAGTYEEQLLVDRNLSLIGIDNPIIEAPDTRTSRTVSGGDTRVYDWVVLIEDVDDFTFDGFVVDGKDKGTSVRFIGVLVGNSKGIISENDVVNARGGTEGGTGGMVIVGDQAEVDVENNIVSAFRKNGITANLEATANIVDNTVVGDGPIDTIAQNGIQIGFGATGNITGNDVSDIFYTGENWSSCGILVINADDVLVEDNTVYDCQSGISLSPHDWETIDNIIVRGNEVRDCESGIYNGWQGYFTGNRLIEDNELFNNYRGISLYDANGWTITGNTVDGSTTRGIGILGACGDNTIDDNTITENVVGVLVGNDGYGDPDNTVVSNNIITGNTNYGLEVGEYGDPNEVDATYNWWGHESGPYHDDTNLSGLGDAVTDNVLFSPWWANEEMDVEGSLSNITSNEVSSVRLASEQSELPNREDLPDLEPYR